LKKKKTEYSPIGCKDAVKFLLIVCQIAEKPCHFDEKRQRLAPLLALSRDAAARGNNDLRGIDSNADTKELRELGLGAACKIAQGPRCGAADV
jgi:hypothetical protein